MSHETEAYESTGSEAPEGEAPESASLLERAKADFKQSQTKHAFWRKKAREAFDFVAGGDHKDSGQWLKEDLDNLIEQKRPPVTFNKIEPMVEAVTGAEINNRQEPVFRPREPADTAVCDALSEVSKWALDNDCEEESSDAFRNAVICGVGWAEAVMDYDEDPDGRFRLISEDPICFRWDPASRRPNLSDARWLGRIKEITKDEYKALFPDAKCPGYPMVFGVSPRVDAPGEPESEAEKYPDDYSRELETRDPGNSYRDCVALFEYQYWKAEPVYRVINPETGVLDTLDKETFSQLRDTATAAGIPFLPVADPSPEQGIRYVAQTVRKWRRAYFSGSQLVEDKPCPWPKGATLRCITGRRDHNKNIWYGIVRSMMDPQRFTNKFLSQAIHQYNTSVKAPLKAEEDAVSDQEAMVKAATNPGGVIWTLPGRIESVQQLPASQIPPDLFNLLNFAYNAPPAVTGINLEFLGLAGRDQPIGLEQTRKLATLSVLAPLFSNYRKYRKGLGQLLMHYIVEFFTPQTLTRVLSQEARPHVEHIKDADVARFDVHVDEAPLSPSMKATVFSVFKDMMQFGPPDMMQRVAPAFMRYSPLPESLVQEVLKAFQPPPPDPKAEEMAAAQIAKVVSEATRNLAQAQLAEAKAATEDENAPVTAGSAMAEILNKMADSAAKLAAAKRPPGDGSR